ncbi:MAG: hypothetical protein MRZ54_01560, partial [Clostridiales bacterium]|nr:hypothetical protein [Clostridiales bacterium]
FGKCCVATAFYHGENNHYGFFHLSVQLDFTINLKLLLTLTNSYDILCLKVSHCMEMGARKRKGDANA